MRDDWGCDVGKKQPELANLYRREYMTKRGLKRTKYYCRYTDVRGKRRIEALGSNPSDAKERYHEIMRSVAQGVDLAAEKERQKAANFAIWAEQWLNVTQHKRSHEKDQVSIRRLVDFFGEVPLSTITADRIEAYKAQRRGKINRHGKLFSPASINRELGALRSVLYLAQQSGLIRDRPPIRFYRENNERDRTYSVEEYHRILALLRERYRPALVMLWELGARVSEVCGLTWSCVNFERKAITFDETKTDPRTIPMSGVVEQTLRSMLPREGDDHVFDFNDVTFKDHVRKRLKKAGIDGWVHDFRRSFVTRKILEGWDYRRIMRITGHRDLKIFTRYNQPTFEDLRGVVESGGNVVATQFTSPKTPSDSQPKH